MRRRPAGVVLVLGEQALAPGPGDDVADVLDPAAVGVQLPVPLLGERPTELPADVLGHVLACRVEDGQLLLVEELAGKVNHHLTEEELTILNPAREDVAEDVRRQLGRAFAEERNKQLDADCGRVENVRNIVARAGREGLLSED